MAMTLAALAAAIPQTGDTFPKGLLIGIIIGAVLACAAKKTENRIHR